MPSYLYYSVFLIAFLLVLIFGLISATHFKFFDVRERKLFSKTERRLLRLPDVWLSSSMWLLYINNAVMALSVVCSLIVIVMVAYDGGGSPVNVIIFTMVGLTCSFLANYTNGKEKGMAYREAFTILNPICEQYQNRYSMQGEFDPAIREQDFSKLVEARAIGEAVIEGAHGSVFKRSENPPIRL